MKIQNLFVAVLCSLTVVISSILSPVSAKESGSTIMVTTTNLNVRSGAGTQYNVLETLSKGRAVSVTVSKDGWSQLIDGSYVSSKYLKSISEEEAEIIDSQTNNGTLYVWESVDVDDSDFRGSYIPSINSKVEILNYEKASKYNELGYLVDYMKLDSGNHYYAVDSKTKEGKVIQNLSVGDAVMIDGNYIIIDGEIEENYNVDKNAIVSWGKTGYATVIQTCIPPYHGPIVLKYGHIVASVSK